MRIRLPAPHHPLHLVIGQLVWLAWFVAVYAAMSIGCATDASAGTTGLADPLNLALLAATLLVAAGLPWASWALWRERNAAIGPHRFVPRASAWLYALAAAATLWVGVPLLLMPACV